MTNCGPETHKILMREYNNSSLTLDLVHLMPTYIQNDNTQMMYVNDRH